MNSQPIDLSYLTGWELGKAAAPFGTPIREIPPELGGKDYDTRNGYIKEWEKEIYNILGLEKGLLGLDNISVIPNLNPFLLEGEKTEVKISTEEEKRKNQISSYTMVFSQRDIHYGGDTTYEVHPKAGDLQYKTAVFLPKALNSFNTLQSQTDKKIITTIEQAHFNIPHGNIAIGTNIAEAINPLNRKFLTHKEILNHREESGFIAHLQNCKEELLKGLRNEIVSLDKEVGRLGKANWEREKANYEVYIKSKESTP